MKLLAVAKRVIPFLLGLVVGVLPSWIFAPVSEVPAVVFENGAKYGKSYCDTGRKKFKPSKAYRSAVETPLAIESKPRPGYTDRARRENIQGTVKLSVEFRADGSIGDIGVIDGLSGGLTEKAIGAAETIRFRPALVNGVAVDSTKLIEYTFAIY